MILFSSIAHLNIIFYIIYISSEVIVGRQSLWTCSVVTEARNSPAAAMARGCLESATRRAFGTALGASLAPWTASPGSLLWPPQSFHNSAEWLRWSINTLWIAPGGENGHTRDSKKPKRRVHSEFCNNNIVDLVQWKMGWGPKTIIAAIVLVVTQSLKCNIQEGHFITSNRASIMCKICSLNGLAIISIISGCSEG